MSRASALVAIALPCLVSASAQEPRATPDPLDGVDAVESGSWVSVAHGDEFTVRLPLAACRTEAGGFVAALTSVAMPGRGTISFASSDPATERWLDLLGGYRLPLVPGWTKQSRSRAPAGTDAPATRQTWRVWTNDEQRAVSFVVLVSSDAGRAVMVRGTLFGVDRLGAAVRLLERIVDTVELGPGDGRPR